jgi:hypothetical protein
MKVDAKKINDEALEEVKKRKAAGLQKDNNPFTQNEKTTSSIEERVNKAKLKKSASAAKTGPSVKDNVAPAPEMVMGDTSNQVASMEGSAPVIPQRKLVQDDPVAKPRNVASKSGGFFDSMDKNTKDLTIATATPLLVGLLMGNVGDAYSVTAKTMGMLEKRQYDAALKDAAAKKAAAAAKITSQEKKDAATLKYQRDWEVAGRKFGHLRGMQDDSQEYGLEKQGRGFGQEDKTLGSRFRQEDRVIDKKYKNKTVGDILANEMQRERDTTTYNRKESSASMGRQHDYSMEDLKHGYKKEDRAADFENVVTRDNAKRVHEFNLLGDKNQQAIKAAELKHQRAMELGTIKDTSKERFTPINLKGGKIGMWSNLRGVVDPDTKEKIDSSGMVRYQPSDPKQFGDKLGVQRESNLLEGKNISFAKDEAGNIVAQDRINKSVEVIDKSNKYSLKQKKEARDMVTGFDNSKKISGYRDSLDEADKFLKLINLKQPIADSVALFKLARLAQGAGVLTQQDVDAVSGSRSWKETVKQIFETKKSGKLTKTNRKNMLALVKLLKKEATNKIKKGARSHLRSNKSLTPIDFEDYSTSINELVNQYTEPKSGGGTGFENLSDEELEKKIQEAKGN